MKSRTISLTAACGLLTLALGAAPASSAGAEEEYLIGGGDVLQVNVWKNAELTQTVTVRPDGRITLPLIRDVAASGLTAVDLGAAVAKRLSAFVNAPNVTITVVAANSHRVYTQGALATGMHLLAERTTARQLLLRAGGGSPEADLAQAYVLRREARLPVDLSLADRGQKTVVADLVLRSGDILVVPFREVESGRVLVVGEVNSPQAIPFEAGMTLLDAFLRAGGGAASADLRNAKITRQHAGEEEVEMPVNLEDILKRGLLSGNIALKPGDILVVPFRSVAERVLVVGEVRSPMSLPFREGVTLLDAFVEAGGASDFADLDSVKIVRRQTEGGREEISVDLERVMKKGEVGRNVALAPGDIVVVPR